MAEQFTPPKIEKEKDEKSSSSSKTKSKKATVKKSTVIQDVDFKEIPTDDKSKTQTSKVETEQVDLKDLKEEQKNEKVSIDFMSNDYIEENIKKPTKKSEAPTENKEEENKSQTIEEVQKEIKEIEEEKNKSLKPQDYEEISSLVIGIIDFLMSSLLKWWGKDSSDAAYTLNEKKMKTLSHQMSLILIKHQQKWSIEMLFVFTLIAVYAGPVMAAKENRKNPADRKPGRPSKK